MSYEEIKKDAEANKDNIELRSEKVRNIIGQMPPFLIRWGNTIIFVILLLLAIAVSIAKCTLNSTKRTDSEIPVIDISKRYPEKVFYIQDIADVEYVPLETTDDVLLSRIGRIDYVSDERIIAVNSRLGDVFVFGRDGKILSHFNHKGQSGNEYPHINQIVYDEKRKELYIYTLKKFLVFSEKGEHIRTLKITPDTNFNLFNFDDETLLAYDKFGTEVSSDKEYRIKPYLFLSKKDGTIVGELNRILPVRYSNYLSLTVKDADGKEQPATMSIALNGNNWHDGEDFVFADLASDTIFQMTKDKKMSPLIIRKPSVHDNKRRTFFTPLIKTDKFIFLSKCVVDFDEVRKGTGSQQNDDYCILYNFINKEVCEASFRNRDLPENIEFNGFAPDHIDIGKNMAACLIESHKIVDYLENKKIQGTLLPIAQKLSAEDNPVLMIMKFK
jgi:hypothetical protein